jgi:hypothetical protein
VLVVNTLAINTPALGGVLVRLPGADDRGEFIENRLLLVGEAGYTGTRPQRSPRTVDLLEAAKRNGTPAFASDFSPETTTRLNSAGMFIFARLTGLAIVAGDDPVMKTGQGIFLARRPVPPGGPAPCQRFDDGTGLYVFRGVPKLSRPNPRSRLTCPL